MAGSLEEIARIAGVAKSTVSRALSGAAGVSETRKSQIIRIARDLGLAPDRNASSLRTGRGTDLVIITVARPTEIVSHRNYTLFSLGKQAIGSIKVMVRNENEELDSVIRQVISQRCRAILISSLAGEVSPETLDRLRNERIPLVAVDSRCPGADIVGIDRRIGMYQATRMLILSGCNNPLFYSSASMAKPDRRLQGIIKAFESLGKDSGQIQLVKFTAGSLNGGYEATQDVLRTRAVDGLFCYSDAMAIGALRALAEAGVRVPQDVKVIGFDNIPVAEYLPVSLTTIAQPVEDLSRAAIEMILVRLENYDSSPVKRIFPTRLVLRESAPIADHALRELVFAQPEFSEEDFF